MVMSLAFNVSVKSKFVPDASTNWIWVLDWIFTALISFAHMSLTFKSLVKSRFVPEASTKSINLDEVMVSLIVISFAFNVSVKSKFVPDASTNWIWVLDWIFTALISFVHMSLTFKSLVKSRFVPEASSKSMKLDEVIVGTVISSAINFLIFNFANVDLFILFKISWSDVVSININWSVDSSHPINTLFGVLPSTFWSPL